MKLDRQQWLGRRHKFGLVERGEMSTALLCLHTFDMRVNIFGM